MHNILIDEIKIKTTHRQKKEKYIYPKRNKTPNVKNPSKAKNEISVFVKSEKETQRQTNKINLKLK